MIQQFDDDIADEPDDLDDPDELDMEEMSGDDFDIEDELEPEPIEITPPKRENGTKRRPPPPLISISDLTYSDESAQSEEGKLETEEGVGGKHRLQFHCTAKERKRPIPGSYPPALSIRSTLVRADSKQAIKRCRVDMAWMGLDQIEGSIHQEDVLAIAQSECEMRMFTWVWLWGYEINVYLVMAMGKGKHCSPCNG